eukprot:9674334-Lingulodinium_polyedra.AAC.1
MGAANLSCLSDSATGKRTTLVNARWRHRPTQLQGNKPMKSARAPQSDAPDGEGHWRPGGIPHDLHVGRALGGRSARVAHAEDRAA